LFFLPHEVGRLIAAAAPHLPPLLTFLVGTGARIGSEALELDWRDVVLVDARAILWRTKGGKRRNAQLPPRVIAALANLPHRDGPVFLGPHGQPYADRERRFGGQIKTAWAGALTRARSTLFELEDLGARQLARFTQPQHCWRVVGENSVVNRFEALRSGTTPLVGREEELDQLLVAWQQARTVERRVVLVSREPGNQVPSDRAAIGGRVASGAASGAVCGAGGRKFRPAIERSRPDFFGFATQKGDKNPGFPRRRDHRPRRKMTRSGTRDRAG